jgi:hypothetical protein
MAMALVPAAGGEVAGEPGDAAGDGAGIGEDPARLRGADVLAQERLGPGVVGLAEAVAAVDGDRDVEDLDLAAENFYNMVDGREAGLLGGDDLGHVVVEPEAQERLGVEGEDRHRAAADAAQLAQAAVEVAPLVDGDRRHRGVEVSSSNGSRSAVASSAGARW